MRKKSITNYKESDQYPDIGDGFIIPLRKLLYKESDQYPDIGDGFILPLYINID